MHIEQLRLVFIQEPLSRLQFENHNAVHQDISEILAYEPPCIVHRNLPSAFHL